MAGLGNIGNFLGGLAQVGGGGAAGMAEGALEGEKLRRLYSTQDLNNQIRQFDLILKQREAEQPQHYQPGAILRDPRTGAITQLPDRPLTDVERANAEYAREHAAEARARADALRNPKPTALTAEQIAAWEAYQKQNPGKTFWDFWKEYRQLEHPGQAGKAPTYHYVTGPDGRVRAIAIGPDGQPLQADFGQIGKPQVAPGAAAGNQTTTTSTTESPGKPLDNTGIATWQKRMPEVTESLNKKIPGFNDPKTTVVQYGGRLWHKPDLIQEAYRRMGLDVTVTYEPPTPSSWGGLVGGSPGGYKIVRATPIQKKKTETVRTKGPRTTEDDEAEEQ